MCQRWLKAVHPKAPPAGEGDLHMLAALRRAGSTLPSHALSRLRALQSRRRYLPAEPGLAFSITVNVERVVQTDPRRRWQLAPSYPDVCHVHMSSTVGRSGPISTTQVHPRLVSSVNLGNLRQLPSSSHGRSGGSKYSHERRLIKKPS